MNAVCRNFCRAWLSALAVIVSLTPLSLHHSFNTICKLFTLLRRTSASTLANGSLRQRVKALVVVLWRLKNSADVTNSVNFFKAVRIFKNAHQLNFTPVKFLYLLSNSTDTP